MIDFGPGSQTRRVAVGLDLGHANDYSALTVIEQRQHHWILRAAHRFPLGTPFGAIVETLRRMARHPDLRDAPRSSSTPPDSALRLSR